MKTYAQTLNETRGIIPKPRPAKNSREEWVERACNAFRYYKRHRHYYDFSNEIYHFLESEGFINFTTARKKQIAMDYIREQRENLSDKLKKASSDTERKHLQADIDKLVTGGMTMTRKLKIAALQIYFKDCMEMEFDLETALKEKQ